ncbi:hypothetical protein L7F22_049400 [Adiantum nelumboides]|nr:hypothetical protein [Adiantum nelumboides]
MTLTTALGPLGVATGPAPADAAALEDAGARTLWLAGGAIDRLDRLTALLDGTRDAVVVPGIVPTGRYRRRRSPRCTPTRPAVVPGATHRAGRAPAAAGAGGAAPPPRRARRTRAARLERLLAALGPRKLDVARTRCAGAVTLLVTPEHTARARAALGPDRLLAVMLPTVLGTDRTALRELAGFLLGVPATAPPSAGWGSPTPRSTPAPTGCSTPSPPAAASRTSPPGRRAPGRGRRPRGAQPVGAGGRCGAAARPAVGALPCGRCAAAQQWGHAEGAHAPAEARTGPRPGPPARRGLVPLRRPAHRRRARRPAPGAGVPACRGRPRRARRLGPGRVPDAAREGLRGPRPRGGRLRRPARVAAVPGVPARRDLPGGPVGQQLLRRPHGPRDGLDPRRRHARAARALAARDVPDGDDRRVRADRAARRVRRGRRHGDHRHPRRRRVGPRRREALDRQRHVRRPDRDLGPGHRPGRRRRGPRVRRAVAVRRHDDHEDRGQAVAADRAERRHPARPGPGAGVAPALRGHRHVRRRRHRPAAHPGQRVVGRGRGADGRLRAGAVLRRPAGAVRPPDRRVPADAGPAGADARQRDRLAGHGGPQRPAARRGPGLGRALVAGEGVLRDPDARDRRARASARGRQRGGAGEPDREVLRRRRGDVLLRGHPGDEHPDRREGDHGAERVRAVTTAVAPAAAAAQHPVQVVGAQRAGEQPALERVDADAAQHVELLGGLDALGDGRAAHRARDLDDGAGEREVGRVGADAGDEGAVDLDRLRRELLEPGQRRVAGAEVVDGEADAALHELAHRVQRGLRQRDQAGLHQLEHQLVPRQPGALDDGGDVGQERRVGRQQPGQVHRDGDGLPGTGPGRGLGRGGAQHPEVEVALQPAALGDRQELPRRDLAVHRVRPAQQRLGREDRAVRADDRLVLQPQRVALDRGAELGLHLQLAARRGDGAPLGDGDRAASALLGLAHRDLGRAQQIVAAGAAGVGLRAGHRGVPPGDADRGGQRDRPAGHGDVAAQQPGDDGGERLRSADLVDVGADHRELVGGQPPGRAVVRQLALQPPGQLDEQRVAGVVPEGGVDAGEVVDVAADHGDPVGVRPGQQPVGELQQPGPVGQPGQRVDGVGLAEHVGGAAALAHVGDDEQPEGAAVVGGRGVDDDLGVDPGAVGAQQRERVDPVGGLRVRRVAQPVRQAAATVGLGLGGQAACRDAAQGLQVGVEQLAERRVGVDDPAAAVEHRDARGDGGDEVGEPLPGALRAGLGPAPVGHVLHGPDQAQRGTTGGAIDPGAARQHRAALGADLGAVRGGGLRRGVRAAAQHPADPLDLLALDGAVGAVGAHAERAVELDEPLAAGQRPGLQVEGPGAGAGGALEVERGGLVRRRGRGVGERGEQHDGAVTRLVPADDLDPGQAAVGTDQTGVGVRADEQLREPHAGRVGGAGEAAERGVGVDDDAPGVADHRGRGRELHRGVVGTVGTRGPGPGGPRAGGRLGDRRGRAGRARRTGEAAGAAERRLPEARAGDLGVRRGGEVQGLRPVEERLVLRSGPGAARRGATGTGEGPGEVTGETGVPVPVTAGTRCLLRASTGRVPDRCTRTVSRPRILLRHARLRSVRQLRGEQRATVPGDPGGPRLHTFRNRGYGRSSACGHAGVARGAGHRRGDGRCHPRVERAGHDLLRGQLVGDDVGDGTGRRDLHVVGDAAGVRVQRAAEDPREGQHVVDLVREVAATGRDDRGVPGRDVRVHLGVGVGQREDHALLGHRGQQLLGQRGAGEPDEHVRTGQGLGDPAGDPARVGDGGEIGLHPAAPGVDDAARVEQHDVRGTRGQQDACAGDARRAGPGDHDAQVRQRAALHPAGAVEGGEQHDGGAVLVVVHDRAVQRLDQAALQLEAARRGDVLEVDRAEGRAQPDQGLHDLVDVGGVEHERDRVEPGEGLEQRRLALHHRQRRARADVAEAEHRGAVADDGDQPVRPGVAGGERGVGGDRSADVGDTGGVGDGEVAGVAQRGGQAGAELAALVRAEDLVPVGGGTDGRVLGERHGKTPRVRRDRGAEPGRAVGSGGSLTGWTPGTGHPARPEWPPAHRRAYGSPHARRGSRVSGSAQRRRGEVGQRERGQRRATGQLGQRQHTRRERDPAGDDLQGADLAVALGVGQCPGDVGDPVGVGRQHQARQQPERPAARVEVARTRVARHPRRRGGDDVRARPSPPARCRPCRARSGRRSRGPSGRRRRGRRAQLDQREVVVEAQLRVGLAAVLHHRPGVVGDPSGVVLPVAAADADLDALRHDRLTAAVDRGHRVLARHAVRGRAQVEHPGRGGLVLGTAAAGLVAVPVLPGGRGVEEVGRAQLGAAGDRGGDLHARADRPGLHRRGGTAVATPAAAGAVSAAVTARPAAAAIPAMRRRAGRRENCDDMTLLGSWSATDLSRPGHSAASATSVAAREHRRRSGRTDPPAAPRRDRVVAHREAHRPHRRPADRRGPGRRPPGARRTGPGPPRRPARPGALFPAHAREGHRRAGRAARGRGRRPARRMGLRRQRGLDHAADPRVPAGLDDLGRAVARRRDPGDVAARADAVLADARALLGGGDVVLVGHGHFSRVLTARWIGLPASGGVHFRMDPAGVSVLGFERGVPRLDHVNQRPTRGGPVSVRTATPDDVPVMVRLVHELADYEKAAHECGLTEDQLHAALFGPDPSAGAFVATGDDGAVVGTAIWFRTFSTWEGVAGIHLEDLYVTPAPAAAGTARPCSRSWPPR